MLKGVDLEMNKFYILFLSVFMFEPAKALFVIDLYQKVDLVVQEEQIQTLQNSMEQMPELKNGALSTYLKVLKLQRERDATKSREQSTANKMLTAVTMAATGIGGMQLAQGLAEQNADAEAEAAMKAYLATFTCEYGGGRIAGGTQNVELPGTNLLTPLIMEYKELAADLKARKEALGMAPGIESEVVLDAAMVGLHNDVNTGKTSGAYTSLSRALSGDADAAAAWDAQKQESAQKVKTGATVGGVGAAGGAVGNAIINGKSGKK